MHFAFTTFHHLIILINFCRREQSNEKGSFHDIAVYLRSLHLPFDIYTNQMVDACSFNNTNTPIKQMEEEEEENENKRMKYVRATRTKLKA